MYNFVASTPVDLTTTPRVASISAVVVTGGTVTLKNGGASGTPVLAITSPSATDTRVFTPAKPVLFGKGLYIDPGAGASGTVIQG